MSRAPVPMRGPGRLSSWADRPWQWWVALDSIRAALGTEIHVGPVIASGSRIIKVQFEMCKPLADVVFDVEVQLRLVGGGAETLVDVVRGRPIIPWFWAKSGFEWHPKCIDAKEEYDVGLVVVGAELRPALAISSDSVESVFWQVGVLWALP